MFDVCYVGPYLITNLLQKSFKLYLSINLFLLRFIIYGAHFSLILPVDNDQDHFSVISMLVLLAQAKTRFTFISR
jgi:hypothetical protein